MKPNRKALVWVEWQDAVGDSTRTHFEDVGAASLVKNINLGWVLHENASRIVLAHGFSSSGEVDHFTIPQADILSVTPAAYTPRKKPTEGRPSGEESKQGGSGVS